MSVGIPEIDEDHKRFASLINDFNQSIVDQMDLKEIKKRLQLILADARQHFEHEEKLFEQWKYPNADDHANMHVQAIKVLEAIMPMFITCDLMPEWIAAGMEVKDLLINHLLNEDMKYAEFYRNAHELHGKQ